MTSLSVVVPAYNEEKRLPATLARIIEWLRSRQLSFNELVIVDDGSSDGTAALVKQFSREHGCVRLLQNPGNRGKGFSVRNGMLGSRGEWILYTDADLSTPIEECDRLFAAAQNGNAKIAIGSRAVDRSLVTVHQPLLREYSGRCFNLAMRLLTSLPFSDTQCGFKLFESGAARAVFKRQLLDGFSFDVEDLFIARRCGIPAIEVPVQWANVEGSKVRLLSGVKSFGDLLAIRRNGFTGKYNCKGFV